MVSLMKTHVNQNYCFHSGQKTLYFKFFLMHKLLKKLNEVQTSNNLKSRFFYGRDFFFQGRNGWINMKLKMPGISVPIEAVRGGNRQNIHFSNYSFCKINCIFRRGFFHPEGGWTLEQLLWLQHQTYQGPRSAWTKL